MPVNYSGLRAKSWMPHAPSFSLVYLRMQAFILNTKCAVQWAGSSITGFLRKMVVQDSSYLEARPLLYAYSTYTYKNCSKRRKITFL